MKKSWEIIERKYYAIEIKLASPLCVSSGLDEYSDSDVLRNGSGELFVPGTSIAGAFRNYLLFDKDQAGMMGFSKNQDGEMSSVFVSDLYLKQPITTIRDFVSLKENRRVENKFDMEVVETGAEGTLFLQYVKRRNRQEEDFDGVVAKLLWGMQQGEIRLGSKKNRGFGRVELKRVFEKCFVIDDIEVRKKSLV